MFLMRGSNIFRLRDRKSCSEAPGYAAWSSKSPGLSKNCLDSSCNSKERDNMIRTPESKLALHHLVVAENTPGALPPTSEVMTANTRTRLLVVCTGIMFTVRGAINL